MKFHIYDSRICNRAKLDDELIRKYLLDNGWVDAGINNANYIFINTCAFNEKLENLSIKSIQKVQRQLENQKLIVFGCLPAINRKRLSKIYKGITFLPRNLDFLEKFVNSGNSINNCSTNILSKKIGFKKTLRFLNLFFRDIYWDYLYSNKIYCIRISRGCRSNCSYCAIKKAQGKVKSRAITTIIKEFESGLKNGYKIFSLVADDVGCYGRDISSNFKELLKVLLSYKGNYNIIIPEFNPIWLNKSLTKILSNKKIVSLTVPMQSGSNRILRLMNRKYNVDNIVKKLKEIKDNNKDIKIGTHIIVGFPSETKKDFEETKNLLRKFDFDRVKVFGYSERPFILASKIKPKVNNKIIVQRHSNLRKQVLFNNVKDFSLKRLIWNLDY